MGGNIVEERPSVKVNSGQSTFLSDAAMLEDSIISTASKVNKHSPNTKSRMQENSAQKVRASTRLPLEQFFTAQRGDPPLPISLDKNCMTCTQSTHNEAVVRAFKMACLKYEPSTVQFENGMYERKQLI